MTYENRVGNPKYETLNLKPKPETRVREDPDNIKLLCNYASVEPGALGFQVLGFWFRAGFSNVIYRALNVFYKI